MPAEAQKWLSARNTRHYMPPTGTFLRVTRLYVSHPPLSSLPSRFLPPANPIRNSLHLGREQRLRKTVTERKCNRGCSFAIVVSIPRPTIASIVSKRCYATLFMAGRFSFIKLARLVSSRDGNLYAPCRAAKGGEIRWLKIDITAARNVLSSYNAPAWRIADIWRLRPIDNVPPRTSKF